MRRTGSRQSPSNDEEGGWHDDDSKAGRRVPGLSVRAVQVLIGSLALYKLRQPGQAGWDDSDSDGGVDAEGGTEGRAEELPPGVEAGDGGDAAGGDGGDGGSDGGGNGGSHVETVTLASHPGSV